MLRGRLAWAHDFNPDRPTTVSFQMLPGYVRRRHGAARAPDSVLVGASIEVAWSNGWSVGTTFDDVFSHLANSFAGKGAIRYRW
jgi:uncharacterized protein with beta-barrel porin domain